MTLAAVGLEEQAVRNYIKQNKPTYPEFEAWVKKNAKSLNRDAIEKHNAAVRVTTTMTKRATAFWAHAAWPMTILPRRTR